MCGRFTQHYTWAEVHAFLSVFGPPRNLRPRYNIAPTTTIDVIRLDQDGRRELVPMRWGLIPGWRKKSAKEVPATFNARAESVAAKPMFRSASSCCMDRRYGRIEPYPCSGLCGADILGASEVQHSVQHVGCDGHLGRLSPVGLEA